MDDRKKLSLAELEQTQEYQQLTPKQKLFVATYCAGGLESGIYDPISAIQIAYKCKNAESARVMSYAMMSNIRIIAALNRHFNTEPIEQFIVEVDRAIHNKKVSLAQVQALKLKADLLGFAARLPGVNNTATGIIPPTVLAASKETRKSKRKRIERKPASPPPPTSSSEYSF